MSTIEIEVAGVGIVDAKVHWHVDDDFVTCRVETVVKGYVTVRKGISDYGEILFRAEGPTLEAALKEFSLVLRRARHAKCINTDARNAPLPTKLTIGRWECRRDSCSSWKKLSENGEWLRIDPWEKKK